MWRFFFMISFLCLLSSNQLSAELPGSLIKILRSSKSVYITEDMIDNEVKVRKVILILKGSKSRFGDAIELPKKARLGRKQITFIKTPSKVGGLISGVSYLIDDENMIFEGKKIKVSEILVYLENEKND